MGNLDFIDWNKVTIPEPYEELIGEMGIPYPIFPCGKNKAPLTPHGYKDASSDPQRVKEMFKISPGSRIGMPTGDASGIFVVDIDVKDGNAAVDWMVAYDLHNHTKCVRTQSGGYHLWYQMPAGVPLRNTASKIMRGVDTRGNGGYVLIPPSDGYSEWNNLEPAPLPDWLLAELTSQPDPVQANHSHMPAAPRRDHGGTPYGLKALAEECQAIRTAPFGQQEHTLNASALKIGALVGGDEIEEGLALSDLLSAGRSIPSQPGRPAWQPKEIDSKIRRAFQDGMRNPRKPDRLPDDGVDYAAPFLEKIDNRANLPERNVGALIPNSIMDVDGFLADFVNYTTRTARRPQPFAALSAAISLVSALAGRKYRSPSDLWTNLYTVSVIDSSGGKDHARKVIKRLLTAAGLMSYLGGEDIASGTALHTSLRIHPCKLFVLDECGDFLKGILGPKASAHKQQIARRLKELYTASGDVVLGTEYADQSEKNGRPREDVYNPIATICGTSTPAQFWDAVAGASLADGLMGRFLVFIPQENYPPLQDGEILSIPDDLINGAKAIVAGSQKHQPHNLRNLMNASEAADPYTVPFAAQAGPEKSRIERRQETLLKQNEGTYITSLAGRIVENAVKLAMIRAISRCPHDPIITQQDMAWGGELSLHCFDALRSGAERYAADNEGQARMKMVKEAIRTLGAATKTTIYRHIGGKMSIKERDEAISALVEGHWITVEEKKPMGAGRPSQVFRIAQGN
ncbi:bifunctional DNA primase/polymerase [Komagataeibacter medellinensis]|nr:bifunctional DNA primase/polymerase [Komagataeibacter medellinensis]